MPYQATTATHKLLKLRKRIRGVAGGTSAGKTITILTILMDQAQTDSSPTLTSIVSESYPHLKRGAMRDFKNILLEHGYWRDESWNATDSIYTFETGSRIEFFSADQPSKVRGPRRDRLYINEANNVPYEAFDQLEVRTKDQVWLDWNPTNEFWWYTDVAPVRDHDFITLTYLDNEALDPQIVASIESRRENKAWWQVYGLGQLGEVEGRIYTGWQIVDSIPHEARLERRGLDFGYDPDPTAIVAVYSFNGGYILDLECYRRGMFYSDMAAVLENLPETRAPIFADSSDKRGIAELSQHHLTVIGAQKVGDNNTGENYLKASINIVQGMRVSMTSRSVDLIKEYRNYMWKFDRDGKQLSIPEGGNDHALDAARYALESFKPKQEVRVKRGAYSRRTTW